MSLDAAIARIGQIQSMMEPLRGATATQPSQPAVSATASGGASTSAPLATASAYAPQSSYPAAAATGAQPTSFANVLATQTGTLSPRAANLLTAGQRTFATQLAAETGLNPQVVASWMLAEQSGGAAKSREAAGNHNWLNIGYTDSGTYGNTASVWSDPASAAHATAGWLKGEDTVDGYGRASAGVQSILNSAGQSPEAQVQALQRSGWASSGYPDLPAVLRMVGA
ncbi:hypothetical protein Q5424_27180 [Conexibacter sp. JD483]|uniref:hypothetical protein n=1 Tax=unclassified Conexibacter TaxID=2627773 RepID=UPI00271FBD15|nr:MULTISPECIES: hypothetical protein [unclassified Conexibacter]MDO8185466.1 hypothetical protein [Conexibacter sp. CPCC 205706]MDO8197347.1 hypothetical protein [Conexibacter sp. CPCC 205762]MDR9372814.1 hypothetical protein [Conexibacter sp. JD483]